MNKIVSKNPDMFTEVPAREFQLFFKNYPEETYPKEEEDYCVNLGSFSCYSHRNLKNEIIGVFEDWNNCELHSRYFIRTDLKEYVNDKENFGKFKFDKQWEFLLSWQFWSCPDCDYRIYIEPFVYPPSECPKCHKKLSADKYKGAFIDSEIDKRSHDELCDAVVLLQYQRDVHRKVLKELTGCPFFGEDRRHPECMDCKNERFEECWGISYQI